MAGPCTYHFTDENGNEVSLKGLAAFQAYLAEGGLEHLFPKRKFPWSAGVLPERMLIDGKERWTVNSDGKPIANSEEAVRNFWLWFGDSKVVDAQGRPLVVYHGTSDDFAAFDLEHWNRHDSGWLGKGAYLTTSTDIASSYSNLKAGKAEPNVMALYAALKNPYRATIEDKRRLQTVSHNQGKNAGLAASEQWSSDLKLKGFDGVILTYPEELVGKSQASSEIVAFSPNQIKSAIGNSGAFSPETNDIRYSKPELKKPSLLISEADAKQHLLDNFGVGINNLIGNGVLRFTNGKEAWPEAARKAARGDEEAVYINGKAYIDLASTGRERLNAVVLHELGEHYSLRRMLGDNAYRALQQQIANRAKIAGSRAEKVWNEVKRNYDHLEEGGESFVSEVIAKLGELDPKAPWYRRLLSQIKSFLMQHGLARGIVAGTITESDLHTLLRASLDSAARGFEKDEPRLFGLEMAYSVADRSERPVMLGFLEEFAKDDEIFGYPVSDKKDLAGVMREVAPMFKYRPELNAYVTEAKEAPTKVFKTESGKPTYVVEGGGKVWIDVSSLRPGDRGGAFYAAVGNYAYNNGLEFIDDPAGVSREAVLRRPQHMLSLALKFGTTDFLGVSRNFEEQSKKHGLPLLNWGTDSDRNLVHLIIRNVTPVYQALPGLLDIKYDFETKRFRRITDGRALQDVWAKRISVDEAARRNNIGEATIRRAVFLQSLASSSREEKSRLLEELGATGRLAGGVPLKAAFSRPEELPEKITIDGKERHTTNSDGKPIANSEEAVRNFWRWFGDSKIVDGQGRPLVVYHGTRAGTFEEFKTNFRKNEQLGFGIHFSEDLDFATRYAEDENTARKGKHPRVYSVYLNAASVLKADSIVSEGSKEFEIAKKLAGRNFISMKDQDGVRQTYLQHSIDATSPQRAEKILSEAGYSGIEYKSKIVQRTVGGAHPIAESRSFIVFNANQIKSAMGNSGAFSPETNDIRYSKPAEQVERSLSEEDATQHLLDHFGVGIRNLIDNGILRFTNGKQEWPEAARKAARGDEEAVYINGKAYIDLASTGRERLSAVVLHELGEHYSLRRMLGDNAYRSLQQQVTNRAKIAGSRAEKVWNTVKRNYDHLEEGSEAFVSEVIAKLGELDPKAPWYRRLISQIKAFLMQHGLARGVVAGTITEADLHILLRASLNSAARRLEKGEPRLLGLGMAYSVPAWHGTPHTVDKFSTKHIGTGEGAQAYGWGLYFADSRDVAEYYKKTLARDLNFKFDSSEGITRDEVLKKVEAEYGTSYADNVTRPSGIADRLMDNIVLGKENPYLEGTERYRIYSELEKRLSQPSGGRLYQVELAPEEDEFLLWDKPLSEQSEKVQEAISTVKNKEYLNPTKGKGLDLYARLSRLEGSDKAASEYLHSLDIRGIKYLDGSSRGKSGATVTVERLPVKLPNGNEWAVDVKTQTQGSQQAYFETKEQAEAYASKKRKEVEGNYNYVVFSDDDVNIVAQFSRPEKLPGKITIDGKERHTTNSEGKQIHPTEQGVRNFWKWFADSAVVDEQGRPQVMYHGTTKDFTSFDVGEAGQKDSGWYGTGFYFTPDTLTASAYADYDQEATGQNVIPVYLKIENPFEWTSDVVPMKSKDQSDGFRRLMMKMGIDGVFVENKYADPKFAKRYEVVVFEPNQIKSATGNTGDFSGESNDIRFSRLGDKIEQLNRTPEGDNTWLGDVVDTLDKAADTVFRKRLAFLSVKQIIEVAKHYMPGLNEYENLMQSREALISGWLRKADRLVSETWRELPKPVQRQLAKAMHESTLEDVHAGLDWSGVREVFDKEGPQGFEAYTQYNLAPSYKAELLRKAEEAGATILDGKAIFRSESQARNFLPEIEQSEATLKKFRQKNFPDIFAKEEARENEYRRLAKLYKALPEQAQKVYTEATVMHDDLFKDRLEELQKRIVSAVENGQKQKALLAQIREKFESQSINWYYAPLARYGSYWFYGEDANGERWFRTFETKHQWERGVEEFEANGKLLGKGRNLDNLELLEGEQVSDSFIKSVQSQITETVADKDTRDLLQDQIYQMFLQTLPDISVRHSSMHRKGTKGYTEDAMRAYSSAMHHGATQLGNMKYGRDMRQVLTNHNEAKAVASGKERRDVYQAIIDAAEMLQRDWKGKVEKGVLESELAEAKEAEDEDQVRVLNEAIKIRDRLGADHPSPNGPLDYIIEEKQKILGIASSIPMSKLTKASDVLDELVLAYDHMVKYNSTDMDRVASMLNQMNFVNMLGFGLSSGIVNMIQTPGVAMPVAVGRHGSKTVPAFNKAFMQFMKAVASGKRDVDGNASITEELRTELEAAKSANNSAKIVELEDEVRMLEGFKDDGTISRTQTFDIIGVGQEGASYGGRMQEFSKWSGWMFHHGERLNREVTLTAAYRLEKARLMSEGQSAESAHREAIEYARYVNNRAHLDYSSENAARIFRGPLARIALQFKKYQQGMLFLWGKSLADAIGKIDEAEFEHGADGKLTANGRGLFEAAKRNRQEARRTFMALVFMQGSLAGALSMPMMGAISALYGMLGAMIGDDDEPWDLEKDLRLGLAKYLGDVPAEVAAKGFVNAFTSVNLASRLDQADIFFKEPLKEMEGRDAATAYLAEVLGPTGGTVAKVWQGMSYLADGYWMRGAESMTPKFVGDIVKAARFAEEGAKTLDNMPLKDMSAMESFMQGLGFGSSALERRYAERGFAKEREAAIKDTRTKIMREAAWAKIKGEPVDMAAIRAWNLKHPEKKILAENISASMKGIKQSVKIREEKGYSVDPKLEYLYEENEVME